MVFLSSLSLKLLPVVTPSIVFCRPLTSCMSGYSLFVKEWHRSRALERKDESGHNQGAGRSKDTAVEWKSLSEDERSAYTLRAKKMNSSPHWRLNEEAAKLQELATDEDKKQKEEVFQQMAALGLYRPPDAYRLFQKEKMAEGTFQDMGDVWMSKCAELWKALPAGKRRVYFKRAAEGRQKMKRVEEKLFRMMKQEGAIDLMNIVWPKKARLYRESLQRKMSTLELRKEKLVRERDQLLGKEKELKLQLKETQTAKLKAKLLSKKLEQQRQQLGKVKQVIKASLRGLAVAKRQA